MPSLIVLAQCRIASGLPSCFSTEHQKRARRVAMRTHSPMAHDTTAIFLVRALLVSARARVILLIKGLNSATAEGSRRGTDNSDTDSVFVSTAISIEAMNKPGGEDATDIA
ncbi:hypothetical protein RRF57_009002 [Xylaria bambusicola]|uniref:Uncharacterized protein n=1 Tax=Xylaria bambusicola TaxID=326684 RepID=A0AAN7V285_9PEZI